MVIEGQFYFNGIERWNLGWPTPNYAGAFLATLICLLWGFRISLPRRIPILLIECALIFLLAKTYSRGALVALCAGVFFSFARHWSSKDAGEQKVSALRLAIICIAVVTTGFSERIAPKHLIQDRSAINRVELWKGGLQMVAASPISGWGLGESGSAYMNWFQDVEQATIYNTMVNSYLSVSAEFGLPVVALILASMTSLVFLSLSLAFGENILPLACGCSLVAWISCNVFTTLWSEWRLWVVPVFCVLAILWFSLTNTPTRRASALALLGGALAALVFCATIYTWGHYLLNSREIHVRTDGVIVSLRTPSAREARADWMMYTDDEVLGENPGKEIRRWMQAAKKTAVDVVLFPDTTIAPEIAANVVLFGRNSDLFPRFDVGSSMTLTKLYIVHPTRPPRAQAGMSKLSHSVVLYLPEVDTAGVERAWKSWSAAHDIEIRTTADSGTDLRAAWERFAFDSWLRQ